MSGIQFLALDLGAESGRGVLGKLDGKRLELKDVHRFSNGPVRVLNSLHWDVLRLFSEMKKALGLAASEAGGRLAGVGVDTWGVDFGLLGRGDVLLGNPYHYRDERTAGLVEEACRRVPREEIFEHTGIQFIELNTLYQLLAMADAKSPLLDLAQVMLMMPDLFNFWLTGEKVSEFSIATTSQFHDPRLGDWSRELLGKLGIPTHFLPKIVPPGTVLGDLLGGVAEETGAQGVRLVAPACHDTGSAVAAVPATTPDYAYISSGTWSLMGVEITEPIINADALRYNFTNEGGVCGTFRFLKNIMGLWLVQECRRTWQARGEEFSYEQLSDMADSAPRFQCFVEPDDPAFLRPGDLPARVREFCIETGQPVPADTATLIRVLLESLALRYAAAIDQLAAAYGHPIDGLHIVGGGSNHRLLCRLTAGATGLPVRAGPVEATAIGNLAVQAIAAGELASIAEARELAARSFPITTYDPTGDWAEARARFAALTARAAGPA